MISNELYDGQGLGNQLWNYALTRIIAEKNHCEFSVLGRENFKGREFMNINFGSDNPKSNFYYKEKMEYFTSTDIDISRTDLDLLKIKPFTKFDGNCQSTQYLEGYEEKLQEWILVKDEYKKYAPEKDSCVIHFRAGDFKKIKDVFLPQKYYLDAIHHMQTEHKVSKFYCVTDEKAIAQKILPSHVEIIGSALLDIQDKTKATHHKGGPLGIDFSLILQADYLIIPNSSFSWWAAYLNKNKKAVIAPKYWARHNISDGYWSTSDIITTDFTYLDKRGSVFSSQECLVEKEAYEKSHPDIFSSTPNFNITPFGRIKKYLKNIFKHELADIEIKDLPQKKYDAFIFFNELELLEIRLHILDPHVDYFVLVEATQTFTGNPKPLYYLENKEKFSKWNDKIIHFVVDTIPSTQEEIEKNLKQTSDEIEKEILHTTLKTDNISQDAPQWMREFYQKECIRKALRGISDDAICFVSDIDEIWNPHALINYDENKIFKLKQNVSAYYLNNRSSEKWAGTFLTSYKNIKHSSINHLDTPSKTKYTYINNGGWHFTNMGGADRIRQKLESYGHQEFNNDKIKLDLEKKIELNKDFIGRRFKFWVDETNLPEYIINNRDKYKNLFK